METQTCPTCREPLPPRASTGRRRIYCSDRCRDDAYRERLAQATVWESIDEQQAPVDEETLKKITAEAISEALANKPEATPEERLAMAILESRNLAWHYNRLGRELRPDLSWRADRMSDSILTALRRLFSLEETK